VPLTLTGDLLSGCVFKRQNFETTVFSSETSLKCCYIVNQHMHTLRQNYNNVSLRQLVHISVLTSPSSGSAQLHKTIVRPYYLSSPVVGYVRSPSTVNHTLTN
jgi:hypothetical protein